MAELAASLGSRCAIRQPATSGRRWSPRRRWPPWSRKGNCYDNAVMGSFWSTIKLELVYRQAQDLAHAPWFEARSLSISRSSITCSDSTVRWATGVRLLLRTLATDQRPACAKTKPPKRNSYSAPWRRPGLSRWSAAGQGSPGKHYLDGTDRGRTLTRTGFVLGPQHRETKANKNNNSLSNCPFLRSKRISRQANARTSSSTSTLKSSLKHTDSVRRNQLSATPAAWRWTKCAQGRRRNRGRVRGKGAAIFRQVNLVASLFARAPGGAQGSG